MLLFFCCLKSVWIHFDIWFSTKVLSRPQVKSKVRTEMRPLTCPVSACHAARAAPTAGTTHPAWCRRMVLCGSLWPPSRVCAWCWTWPAWWWSTTSGGTRWGATQLALNTALTVHSLPIETLMNCVWKCRSDYSVPLVQYYIIRLQTAALIPQTVYSSAQLFYLSSTL